MKIKSQIYSVMAALSVLSLGACSNDLASDQPLEPARQPAVPLALEASIRGQKVTASGQAATSGQAAAYSAPATRAKLLEGDDCWSYESFTDGDHAGFFSQHGDESSDNGTGPLNNIMMTYETVGEEGSAQRASIFTSDLGVSPSLLSQETTFVYFPYDENVMGDGIELRRKDTNDSDTLKCVDFLLLDGIDLDGLATDGMMHGEFFHAFSELIIMRGNGFDNPKNGNYSIRVYLKQPYTHLKLTPVEATDKTPWRCEMELLCTPDKAENKVTNSGNADPNADTGNRAYCVWEAWSGENYGKTPTDNIGRKAWYVILPTIGDGSGGKDMRTMVDYIELYDNEGQLQTVSSLKLSGGNSKMLDAMWRYPFEISMQELVPTVNPYPIQPWGENVDITYERECGIHNMDEFNKWKQAYATYLTSKDGNGGSTDSSIETELLKYGSKEVQEDGEEFVCWHFYLMDDLDFSEVKGDKSGEPVIPKLEDVLDGESYTLSGSVFQNHTLRGLTAPFVGEMSGENAILQNITFENPEINMTETTGEALGAVVKKMSGGKVTMCNVINGRILSGGAVGMVAGTFSGGTISGCNLSGILIGASTQEGGVVGTKTNGATLEDNNAASVVFNEKSN